MFALRAAVPVRWGKLPSPPRGTASPGTSGRHWGKPGRCNPRPSCLGEAVGAAARLLKQKLTGALEAAASARSHAGTLLTGRTRLFHLQADKGHFFSCLPPVVALGVLKLYFCTTFSLR